jgi:pimeloyl-ACP methyl ester carboxylesterase
VRFLDAMGSKGPVMVGGHDIGGGVAQHLLISRVVDVPRLALVNAVMYDSWSVPGVARFRDPAVAAATSTADVLAARRQAVTRALARPASEAEIAEYLGPWTDPRVARSWLALAGAADNRHTLELLPGLCRSTTPKLLVWGEDDQFQTVDYAERFAAEIPATRLVRIPAAGHIPTENNPRSRCACAPRFLHRALSRCRFDGKNRHRNPQPDHPRQRDPPALSGGGQRPACRAAARLSGDKPCLATSDPGAGKALSRDRARLARIRRHREACVRL